MICKFSYSNWGSQRDQSSDHLLFHRFLGNRLFCSQLMQLVIFELYNLVVKDDHGTHNIGHLVWFLITICKIQTLVEDDQRENTDNEMREYGTCMEKCHLFTEHFCNKGQNEKKESWG